MSKQHHDEGGELHFEQISHHGVRYEPRDLGGRGIIVFLIVLIVSGAVICGAVWGYYDYRLKHTAAEPSASAAARAKPQQGGNEIENYRERHNPSVMLQTDDVADMGQLRANEDQVLNNYSWADQRHTVAHIPIDDAIKSIAQKGLPTRAAPPTPTAAQFGSGADTVPGLAGGTRPVARQ
jgi:hypothetical protein